MDLTGLDIRPTHRIEISDAVGRSVWECTVQTVNDTAFVDVPDSLRAGQYWLRVHDTTGGGRGRLLREFSLRLE